MSIPSETKVYVLANPPTGAIKPDTFKLETRSLPKESELKDGELLFKTVALSNDPAQRTWMTKDVDARRLYAPPIRQGDVVKAGAMLEVVAGKSDKFKVGDRVNAQSTWAEYVVLKDDQVMPAKTVAGHSEFISMSSIGMVGWTAYFGAFNVSDLKKEHVVVVSGAAGAVGSIFVQIAKNIVGCKTVIGIAGGKEKCDWVKSLGADDCIDYKGGNLEADLRKAVPDYADVYFDNVGGETLDIMLSLVKRYGKVACCGAISQYNEEEPLKLKNWAEIVYNRLHVQGFIVVDYLKDAQKASSDLTSWIESGKIQAKDSEQVVDTKFEDIPKTWHMLFDGGNRGKLLTKLV